MSRYLNALSQATSTIVLQRWTIGALSVITVLALLGWKTKDTELTVHIPPDLSNGAALKVGGKPEVPRADVYAFGFYIWQQVNNWPKDGAQDYGKQIFSLQHYITPVCREQLAADLKAKAAGGELVTRTRALMEIPGLGFAASRVTDHGDGSWTVLLDAYLLETSRGVRVKDAYIRYPLRVVRYDASREDNPWGLAIDCFGNRRPERLDVPAATGSPTPAPVSDVPAVLPQPEAPIPSAGTPAIQVPTASKDSLHAPPP